MTPKLSKELADAVRDSPTGQLEVVNPENNRMYVVVDGDTHRQAMDASRRRRDRDAISRGIAEREAGEGVSLEHAFNDVRAELNLRQRRQ